MSDEIKAAHASWCGALQVSDYLDTTCDCGAGEINDELTRLRRALAAAVAPVPTQPERCNCPVNEAGDIRCHRCLEYVNVKCWRCGTPRGEGSCPARPAATQPEDEPQREAER